MYAGGILCRCCFESLDILEEEIFIVPPKGSNYKQNLERQYEQYRNKRCRMSEEERREKYDRYLQLKKDHPWMKRAAIAERLQLAVNNLASIIRQFKGESQ